jgi:integrase
VDKALAVGAHDYGGAEQEQGKSLRDTFTAFLPGVWQERVIASAVTDRYGKALTGNAIRKLFERLKVKSGIRDLSAHMLRHTWATNFPSLRVRFAVRPDGRGRLDY